MSIWNQLMIACPLVFIAGFIDAIAGGGGLISLPAFYMAGLPPHIAAGTNKFSVCWGTLSSACQYIKGGYIYKKIIPVSIAFALVGSYLGARLALYLDEMVLRWVMIVLVPVIAVVTLAKKDFLNSERQELPAGRAQLLTAIVALVIGMYDGFFGPGTGTFLMLAFVGVIKLDAVTACGNTKVVNLTSNLTAMVTFAVSGKVLFALAVPCAFCSIAGNFLGAKLAMKRGVKIIKPIMLVVVALLLIKLCSDLFTTAASAL